MIKNIYEIFDQFDQCTTKVDRIQVLRENGAHYFRQFLKFAFDPQYEFHVKSFPKEYIKPDTVPGLRYAGIESELRRIYLFMKGDDTADKLTEQKRNQILIQLLESFEPREADFFVRMMQKNLRIKYLTPNLIKEAFPDLLPE